MTIELHPMALLFIIWSAFAVGYIGCALMRSTPSDNIRFTTTRKPE